jgi:divalent metal cation (Fe/Co/Zn/Cd) transporter
MLGPAARRETTDQELAAEDVTGELAVVILVALWSHSRLAGLDHALLAAAEHGGLDAINALIGQAGCGRSRAPSTNRHRRGIGV